MSGRPAIEVLRERETAVGLAFLVGVPPRPGGDECHAIEILLSWADYNLWSPDGAAPPERIAEAVALEALERYGAEELPDPLDAARLRRRWPDADASIVARLRPSSGSFG